MTLSDRKYLDALKNAADPEEVAVALGLQGHRRRFFCPVCQPAGGKSPDLAVLEDGFFCHKCGLKGDLLKLIEVAGGMDFPSAVAWLERETGMKAPAKNNGMVRRDPGASCGPVARSVVRRDNPSPSPDPAVYEAFLSACHPVEGRALYWLTLYKGITPNVVEGCRLRCCGSEYAVIMDALKTRFGDAALLTAGLLKKNKEGRLVPSFWHYYAKKADFLVIPYYKDGRPVYLKVRPPLSKEDAEIMGLVRFMNTAAAVPCLYNLDILATQPDKVLICEGESDTWTALSAGFAAVGVPGAKNFKTAWVESFRAFVGADGRSRVYLALDGDAAGMEGSRNIAEQFRKAGLPVPLKLAIPSGKDLTDFMKEGMTE